jgi:Putative MetA-pathway of phenol degradation
MGNCGKGAAMEKSPKTLLEWSVGKNCKDEDKKEDAEADGDEPDDDTIVTDRPDFTEASSTVGRGRIQLETGYTYIGDRAGDIRNSRHSYPEALLRVGMFAEWFEFRIAHSFLSEANGDASTRSTLTGPQDLYLGVKLGLTEQSEDKRFLPETAVILQMFAPVGHREFTANQVLYGFNGLFGWDINDFLAAGGSFGANRNVDDDGQGFITFHTSFTINYTLTEKLGAYTEWFGLFPQGASTPIFPQNYFDGGFTYKPVPYMQFDLRAGVGLNEHADDFFVGVGYSVKY